MPRPYRFVRERLHSGKHLLKVAAEQSVSALPDTVASRIIPVLRLVLGFEISAVAVERVRDHLTPGGNLLVFSLGRDSSTWEMVNRRGRTVFLEDLEEWIELSRRQAPAREIYAVTYDTERDTSLRYSSVADIPLPTLPEPVQSQSWDAVVVDGPKGFAAGQPGRAASIAWARRLVRPGGLVLVDDYDRPLERRISELVFGRTADEVLDPRRPVGLYHYR